MLTRPVAGFVFVSLAALTIVGSVGRGAQDTAAALDQLAGIWEAHPEHDGETSRVVLSLEKRADGKLVAKWSMPLLDVWEVPIGVVTAEGDDVHAGPLPLKYDPAARTLTGVIPKAVVPVYSIPLTFTKTGSLGRVPRAPLEGRIVSPAWTFDAGAPIWPDVAVCGSLLLAGDDSGRLHAIDAASGKSEWTLTTGGKIRARPTCTGADVLVPSDDGYLYRVGAKNGQQQWRVQIGNPVTRVSLADPKSKYDYRASSATVNGGRVYVGTDQGILRALDARTGNRIWEFAASDTIFSTPTVAGGHVYFGSFDGFVYALDAATGALAWKRDTGAAVTSTPAVFASSVIVGSRSYDLTSFDAASGRTLWKRYYWFSWVESSATVSDGTAYVGSSDAGKAFAFDAKTGRQVWSVDVGGAAWGQPAVTTDRVFVTASGTVKYAVSHAAAVVAIDRRSGRVEWQYPLPPSPEVASSSEAETYGFTGSPAISGAMVYAGALDGRVYAFRQNP